MSSFDEYRQTHIDMLHLVSHLMRLHREPGHLESTPEQRDAYDHIHHRFLDTMHITYTRLEGIGKTPAGEMSSAFAAKRRTARRHRDLPPIGQARRWGMASKERRAVRGAPPARFPAKLEHSEPCATVASHTVHPAPPGLQ